MAAAIRTAAGDRIPFLAQIVRVVDIFDSVTTTRPYRKAVSTVKAFEVLRQEAETGGCPKSLVDRFIGLHDRGQLVVRPDTRDLLARASGAIENTDFFTTDTPTTMANDIESRLNVIPHSET